ncbi:cryptochrome/photolyase family protein [Neotabrizicola shimadae]|uniref:Deoxyribodipyrimidine photo-lyase n=1 Tax=Neotabrizicola shimadae TaxID=2807096 RepID=A0A8G0ZZA1_9RHOB|nr:deoxyribodipyrimidine photo-lyase [Neotabrizicola shimadae]
MLAAAGATGRPVIPVFVLDPETEAIGAAAKWRLGLALATFAARLEAEGSRLVLRRGPALGVLESLLAETGAAGMMWTRSYEPAAITRDAAVKAALKARGLVADSHSGATLAEPWEVTTGEGGFYKVYTPFWKALSARGVPAPVPAARLRVPDAWPASDRLEDWHLGAAMRRGASVLLPHAVVGEAAARARLMGFLDRKIDRYRDDRDRLDLPATSGLSENLAWGEIGPREIWHAAAEAERAGARGAEHFRKELAWRDFAWHLMYHTPQIATANWRPEWDGFAWAGESEAAERWRQGMTGEPVVDAAMREMYVTGTMHNRARMIVASYLTKHLLTHWKIGLDWFADCLTDWDPASNAMGWQWVAGSGPDAAPYFRIFNPATQAEKFDPEGRYRARWLAEGRRNPAPEALSYFAAVPKSWRLDPGQPPPRPLVDLAEGRARALAALAARGA